MPHPTMPAGPPTAPGRRLLPVHPARGIRAAASQAGAPLRQACQDLAQRPGYPAP